MTFRRVFAGLCALVAVGALAVAAVLASDDGARQKVKAISGIGERSVEASVCPERLPGCRAVRGRILYAEDVDPDGDGDAHFVIVSGDSVTAPGVSVVKVPRSKRPAPLPRVGDTLSAAGTIDRGSHGEHQVVAIEVHVSRQG
jgi:hypothetical protein